MTDSRREIPLTLATFSFLLPTAVLFLGWIGGIEQFTRLSPGFAEMVPSTCLSLAVASGAILLGYLAYGNEARGRQFARACGALLLFIASADLLLLLQGDINGIDALLWPRSEAFQESRMAVGTACGVFLLGLSLLLLHARSKREQHTFLFASTLGLWLALLALIGYLFDAEALYETFVFSAMALHTATTLAALFLALLFARSDIGWVSSLFGSRPGAVVARRTLPIVISLPLLLCYLALLMTERGLFNVNFRLSILASTMAFGLSSLLLLNARTTNRADERLEETNADLRRSNADRDLLLREVYHRVKNNLQMTNSLLSMGARSVKDQEAREILLATARRVHAIGTVHRLLISSKVPSEVRFDTFAKELAENILSGQQPRDTEIDLLVEVDDFPLHVDLAVALGLLINELLSNSLKHAFVGRSEGRVVLKAEQQRSGELILEVRDSGVGRSNEGGTGTGTKIIDGLVRQLSAEMSTSNEAGTVVQVRIPGGTIKRQQYG